MIKFIVSLFEESPGVISSKRVMAVALIVSGIVHGFVSVNSVTTGIMITGGTGLLVAAAVSHT